MAFIRKLGTIVKETSHKVPNLKSSVPYVSLYQSIRCFSSSKLFIGGLSYATDENSLKETFSPYGEVVEARIIFDRESGRSKGFGFVSYTSAEEASAAIQALDGRDLHGRFIKVAYAAGQRRTSPSPSFTGASNYGDGGGGYNIYANTNPVHQSNGNYPNPNAVNYEGFSGNGGANYRVEDSLNVGLGGNPGVGYGGTFNGGSGNGSYGSTGSFGMNDYGNGMAQSYNNIYGGDDSSFNGQTPYNNSSWQNQNVDTSCNLNDQNDVRGNVNEDGYVNAKYG